MGFDLDVEDEKRGFRAVKTGPPLGCTVRQRRDATEGRMPVSRQDAKECRSVADWLVSNPLGPGAGAC